SLFERLPPALWAGRGGNRGVGPDPLARRQGLRAAGRARRPPPPDGRTMNATSLFARRSPLRRYGWRIAIAALALFAAWHMITDATRTYREGWLKKAEPDELLAAAAASPDDEDLVFFACARNTPSAPRHTQRVSDLMRHLVQRHPSNATYRFGFAKAAMYAR